MNIIIDPGHGGSDSGAVGATGLREADVNLMLAFYLRARLGDYSVLTRTADVFVSLADRARFMPQAKALISLHCNSCEDEHGNVNPRPQGFEVWTSPGETRADALASCIFQSVVNASPPRRRFRSDWVDHDEDKEGEYTVLIRAPMPAVLVEVAFISNPLEEQQLKDDNWLRLQACAIASGVERWLD